MISRDSRKVTWGRYSYIYPEAKKATPFLLRNGFADFISFEAGAADLHAFDPAFHNGADFVQVRIEASLGGIQSMAAMIAYLSGFSTDIAYS